MTDNLDDKFVKIKKDELDELNSKINEQEVILMHTKEYLFGLQNINKFQDNEIKRLDKANKQLVKENDELKTEVKSYSSSTSWKITKPLRAITNIFRK